MDKLEENSMILVHSTGPYASQFALKLVTVQCRMKGITGKLLKSTLNLCSYSCLAADCSLERSHKSGAPDKRSHSANSAISSATVPRRTSPRW